MRYSSFCFCVFFFSSRRRHTRCALVTGVQTCALPISPAAFTELKRATAHINTALSKAVSHAKLNYLMLMMLDPHVHFHVFPRYEGERSARAMTFADASWPGQIGSASCRERVCQ